MVAAPRTLIDMVGNPGDGPYLSAMGVTAELEVSTSLLGTVEVVGLVVEKDGKSGRCKVEG